MDATQETYNISLKIGESDMIFTYDKFTSLCSFNRVHNYVKTERHSGSNAISHSTQWDTNEAKPHGNTEPNCLCI